MLLFNLFLFVFVCRNCRLYQTQDTSTNPAVNAQINKLGCTGSHFAATSFLTLHLKVLDLWPVYKFVIIETCQTGLCLLIINRTFLSSVGATLVFTLRGRWREFNVPLISTFISLTTKTLFNFLT